MLKKRILLLDGHPGNSSLSRLFVETYGTAANSAGHDIRHIHLADLEFDPDFGGGGYADIKPLEPSVEAFLNDLEWANHVVLAAPLWWGGLPAKLKGLFDRALIPGRAFDTRNTTLVGLPKPVLTGRTGRVILTSDTPGWFLRWVYGNAIMRQITDQIFGFIGITPTRFTYFAGASHPKPGQIDRWVEKVKRIGMQAA